jgi:hypothetical protein
LKQIFGALLLLGALVLGLEAFQQFRGAQTFTDFMGGDILGFAGGQKEAAIMTGIVALVMAGLGGFFLDQD